MGLRSYAIREISSGRKDKMYAEEVLSLHLTLTILSILVSLLICILILQNDLLFITGLLFGYLTVFGRAFDLEFYYVSQKNLAFPTYASLFGQLLYASGVVLLIKGRNDYPILVLLTAFSILTSDIIQIYKFGSENGKIRLKLKFNELISTFKKTYILGISQNLEGFLPTIPQILLPGLAGIYSLGIVSGSLRVYSVITLFYVTLFYALAPYIVKIQSYQIEGRRKYHLLLFLTIFCAASTIGLVLFFFGDFFVILILGDEFIKSVELFKLISITLIPLTPIIMLLGNIFIYSGLEKYYLISLIISGIVSVIISPFLISKYAETGTVYSMIITSSLLLLSQSYFYFRYEKSKIIQEDN